MTFFRSALLIFINSFLKGNLFFCSCFTYHRIRSRSGKDLVEDVTRRMGSWSRSGRSRPARRRIRTSGRSIAVISEVAITPPASAADASAAARRLRRYFQIPRRALPEEETGQEKIC